MASKTFVRLSGLSYVIYEHPSIEDFRNFAKDFGLIETGGGAQHDETYFRGYGVDPFVYVARKATGSTKRFVGAGYVAESEDDLENAAAIEGSKRLDMGDAPGDGQAVVLKDPNGFDMIIVWGQKAHEAPRTGISALQGRPPVNGAIEKRRKGKHSPLETMIASIANIFGKFEGEFTRLKGGPAMVHKLGHFGYTTSNFEATCAWYQKLFNFVPTDVLYAPGDPSLDVATFFRLDRGKIFTDHHCFLIARGDSMAGSEHHTSVHHSSFEVEDIDTQFMGHQWLKQKGHELVWGIGRHVHGSQVFHYWYDPSHFIIEHYADGDVANEDVGVSRAEAGNMAVWGPPVPEIWGSKPQETAAPQPVAVVSG